MPGVQVPGLLAEWRPARLSASRSGNRRCAGCISCLHREQINFCYEITGSVVVSLRHLWKDPLWSLFLAKFVLLWHWYVFAFSGLITVWYCLTDGCIFELYQSDAVWLTVIVLLGMWDRKGPPYSSSLFPCSCKLQHTAIDIWSSASKPAGPFPPRL